MAHHLKKIDLLRGIAILLVFLFHCHLVYFGSDINTTPYSALSTSFSFKKACIMLSPTALGWTGVPLFFVISGFLIHLGFLSSGARFSGPVFFSKRFWRIYPTYWLTLLFFLLTAPYAAGIKATFTDIFLHAITLHNISDRYIYSINASYWSLAAEVQLYLLYPLFLYIRKILGIRNCFRAVLAISLTTLLTGLVFHNFGTAIMYIKMPLQFWFVWAAGAWYAECCYSREKPLMRSRNLTWILLSYSTLTLFSCFSFTSNFAFYPATMTCLLLFDWVIFGKVVNTENAASKLLIVTGLASYSFYLIHQPYLNYTIGWFGGWAPTPFRFLSVIPVFILLLLVSYLLYRLSELPGIKMGKMLRERGIHIDGV